MKLTFSPGLAIRAQGRVAAIEFGLIDRIEFTPATVVPGQANAEYARINPLKKLPALILDNGNVIIVATPMSSSNISTSLPAAGNCPGIRTRPLEGQERSFDAARHARIPCCSAATRKWCGRRGCSGRHGPTITGTAPGAAWRASTGRRTCCRVPRHRADRARLRARLCRFPLRRLRLAQSLSQSRCVPREDAEPTFGQDFRTAASLRFGIPRE